MEEFPKEMEEDKFALWVNKRVRDGGKPPLKVTEGVYRVETEEGTAVYAQEGKSFVRKQVWERR